MEVSLIAAKAKVKLGDILVVRVKTISLGLVVDLMIERSDHRMQVIECRVKFWMVSQWTPDDT